MKSYLLRLDDVDEAHKQKVLDHYKKKHGNPRLSFTFVLRDLIRQAASKLR